MMTKKTTTTEERIGIIWNTILTTTKMQQLKGPCRKKKKNIYKMFGFSYMTLKSSNKKNKENEKMSLLHHELCYRHHPQKIR
mmetsp:Transcript_31211/g.35532  ORF Transcript_31211/g.35532 Transcript_31211/m.35532 type:complete len:82 (+) Transcript_31211:344-589(+)